MVCGKLFAPQTPARTKKYCSAECYQTYYGKKYCGYVLSKEDKQKLLEYQQRKCAICGIEEARNVDHNHKSGEIRGLLCSGCNLGLGWFEKVSGPAINSYLSSTPFDAIKANRAICGL